MPVSRLFTEVGESVDRMNSSLREAVTSAEDAGVKVQKAGQSFLAAFQDALNPTNKLTEQINLLQAAGQTNAEIMQVLGDQIKNAGDAAAKTGQPMSELFASFHAMSAESDKAGLSIESVGTFLGDFAKNPLEAAKGGVASLIEGLGPAGVAFSAFGAAAIAAGVALASMLAGMADEMEQLDNLSAITGISTGDLEAYKQVAKEAGLESLDLGKMIGKLNQELGSDKSSAFKDAVAGLGITLEDLATGKPKDAVTLLDDMRAKLLAIPEGAERAQAANQALGGRLRELIPLLTNSSTSLADARDRMKELGIVTDDYTKNNLKNLDGALDKVGTAWDGFVKGTKNALANMILTLPVIGSYIEGLNKQETALVDVSKAGERMVEEWEVQWRQENAKKLEAEAEAAKKVAKEAEEAAKRVYELGLKHDQASGSINSAIRILEAFRKANLDASDAVSTLGINAVDTAAKVSSAADDLYFKTVASMNKANIAAGKDMVDSLGVTTKQLKDWDESVLVNHKATLSKMELAAKSMANNFVTALSKGFTDMILEGKGFGETMKGVFKGLAGDILDTMTAALFDPLKKYVAAGIESLLGLASKMPGLGGLAPSTGGGGVSIPGVGGGGGGASSIGGAFEGLGTGLLSGVVSGLVSGVVGALISGPTKGVPIEQNTRYTAIDVHTLCGKADEIRDVLWKTFDYIPRLDWIDTKAADIRAGLTRIENILWLIRGDAKAGAGANSAGSSAAPASLAASRRSAPAAATVIINGPIYGWADFVGQVQAAGLELQRRGALSGAAY